MQPLSKRPIRASLTLLVASIALSGAPVSAQSASNACECMVAVCEQMHPGDGNASRCRQLRDAPPAMCRRQLAPMLQMLQRRHRVPPAVCNTSARGSAS